jgi:hypothetical protein
MLTANTVDADRTIEFAIDVPTTIGELTLSFLELGDVNFTLPACPHYPNLVGGGFHCG